MSSDKLYYSHLANAYISNDMKDVVPGSVMRPPFASVMGHPAVITKADVKKKLDIITKPDELTNEEKKFTPLSEEEVAKMVDQGRITEAEGLELIHLQKTYTNAIRRYRQILSKNDDRCNMK